MSPDEVKETAAVLRKLLASLAAGEVNADWQERRVTAAVTGALAALDAVLAGQRAR